MAPCRLSWRRVRHKPMRVPTSCSSERKKTQSPSSSTDGLLAVRAPATPAARGIPAKWPTGSPPQSGRPSGPLSGREQALSYSSLRILPGGAAGNTQGGDGRSGRRAPIRWYCTGGNGRGIVVAPVLAITSELSRPPAWGDRSTGLPHSRAAPKGAVQLSQRPFHVVENTKRVEDLFDLEDSAAIQLPQIGLVRNRVLVGRPGGQNFSLLLRRQDWVPDNLLGVIEREGV